MHVLLLCLQAPFALWFYCKDGSSASFFLKRGNFAHPVGESMSLFALTASLALAVWPAPQHLEVSGDRLPLSPNFHFVADTDPPSQLLLRALARFESQINSTQIRSEDTSSAASGAPALSQCIVRPHSSSEELKMSTDISYNLSVAVSPDGVANCTLDAPTVFGCVAGLETFVQLLVANITPPTLQNTSIHVEDHPDFVHRGVMADTGRRFWPLPLLRNVIDVMAMSKMNVLHLHASDMCRWAVESLIYPELTRNNLSSGDAQRDAAWSAGFGFYSQADIKALTAYAKDRGVRVVPEFDMPGHAAALRPLVGPENRGLELCNPPFTNGSHIPNWCTLQGGNGSAAQRLLPPLVQEMAELFGGELYHMGGDEPRCGGVYDFEKRIISTIEAQNKRVVAWSEVHGNHAASPSTVIQAWRSPNASALAAQGVAGIETSPRRFYLSGSGTFPGAITGAWCDLWQGANGTRTKANASARALLLGGEVALWTDGRWVAVTREVACSCCLLILIAGCCLLILLGNWYLLMLNPFAHSLLVHQRLCAAGRWPRPLRHPLEPHARHRVRTLHRGRAVAARIPGSRVLLALRRCAEQIRSGAEGAGGPHFSSGGAGRNSLSSRVQVRQQKSMRTALCASSS